MAKKVEEERRVSPALLIVPIVGALGLVGVVWALSQAAPPKVPPGATLIYTVSSWVVFEDERGRV
ncbi:unnamed protein product, partial [marine sediment metagenome]